jgi:predicted DNA-binding transcriptional regulator AlpA
MADIMNAAAIGQPPQQYVTIAEFCERFGISRAFYFKLRTQGEGPDEVRIGSRKVVITMEAVQAWEKEHSK